MLDTNSYSHINEVCIDPNLEFLRRGQNILWWNFCLCFHWKACFRGLSAYSAKNPFVQDWSLCVDTQKGTSYLDHFCARKVGVFAPIRNLDLIMKIIKVFHAGVFAHLEIWLPLIKTNDKLIIFDGYYLGTCADIPHYDFGLPMLDFLRIMTKNIDTWMYSAYVRRYS